MNKFGDWTQEEKLRIMGFKASTSRQSLPANYGKTVRKADASIDWTAKGVVSPVKDQSHCGSCWAFSAVGALESAFAIRCDGPKTVQQFSEQQLVDCETDDQGCNGGEMYHAFNYYKSHGACFEEHYPYEGTDNACRSTSCETDTQHISAYNLITNNDPEEIYQNLVWGPHSIGVKADSDVFMYFSSGVIDDDSCGTEMNHGVLLTGYIASTDAWKIKNSWGADWGENGYVYIKDNHTVSPGICGVNQEISRPRL